MQINNNLTQLRQILNQRRQSVSDMIGSVQAGDMATAQKDLSQIQTVDASLGFDPASTGSSSSNPTVKHRMDLTALFSAVQSGDVTAAQNAWNQIQANRANASQGVDANGDQDGSDSTSGLSKDISTLLTAVTSGDATGMKSAADAVSKDMQSLLSNQQQSQTPGQQSAATSTDPRQTVLDDLNAIVAAAQSGDAAKAQDAQAKLVQDLQSLGGQGQAVAGAHHGHHHHHHSETVANLISSTPQQAATFTTPDNTGTAAPTSTA